MPIKSEAQFFVAEQPASPDQSHLTLVPVPMAEPMHQHQENLLEVSEHDHPEHSEKHQHGHEHSEHNLQVEEPLEMAIMVGDIPGAPEGSKDPEPVLEVSEEEPLKVEDDNEAKSAKDTKWDWASHGPTGFIAWIKGRCDDVPKHSGQDSAGLERAIAYLDKLDGEISRAMRLDLDGELDANQIEKVRSMIDDGVSRLHDRLDKVKKVKKTKRTKKKSEEQHSQLIKEAQKIMGVNGVMIVADLLTSRVARTCVNATVSAGHDIVDTYMRQVELYSLNKREQACVRELLECMGYAMREDRAFLPDDDYDFASSSNGDFAAGYKG